MAESERDPNRIYAVERWGEGYFRVDDQGCLRVFPGREGTGARLPEIITDALEQGLRLPLLLRFRGILRDRVDHLCTAFDRARQHDDYEGDYTAVYPIKVNQQRAVVEEIVAHGRDRVGLEAGSKPELMAVLGVAPAESVIVCNGYKDREYLDLALTGQQLGHRVYVVVEKLSEIDALIRRARSRGLRPAIGIRIRLASAASGNWQNTGGEKSKFGLSAGQLPEALERLERAGMTDCLELLHFHLGSQLPRIRDIQRGMREAARFYAELRQMGAPVRVMDVGGGLGVDYEGTRSRSDCSVNYSTDQYAQSIVRALWEVCRETGQPHPDIITESGRALTAHHAVLVTDVVDTEPVPAIEPDPPGEDAALVLQDLWELYRDGAARPPVEVYHDAQYWIEEARQMHIHGLLDLRQRTSAERLYHALCRAVHARLDRRNRQHLGVLDELNEKLAQRLFCNFSLFQSLPDVWAIQQIFPILPLERMNEPLDHRVVVRDLTCDSDGRIDRYVDGDGLETTLPFPAPRPAGGDRIAFFLVGAYQEILGDMHNLFGDTDSVNVELDGPGRFHFSGSEHGERARALLEHVRFEPASLRRAYQDKIAAAGISGEAASDLLAQLDAGLSAYTYLGPE